MAAILAAIKPCAESFDRFHGSGFEPIMCLRTGHRSNAEGWDDFDEVLQMICPMLRHKPRCNMKPCRIDEIVRNPTYDPEEVIDDTAFRRNVRQLNKTSPREGWNESSALLSRMNSQGS